MHKINKAVFFDRDGVINQDSHYVYKIEDFIFYEDFFTCASYFKSKNYKLIVITNQSGIERGYYTLFDFLHISKYMQNEIFKKLGYFLDRIYFCPLLHDTLRRKPAIGMITQAQEHFQLDLNQSYLIGDKMSDIEAGINAGIPNLFLIERNEETKQNQPKNKNTSKIFTKCNQNKQLKISYHTISSLDYIQ
ncbi:HAD family hydrolase [Helicobacter didelphidarum]|uniref:D,D-heptose 1,7-bisphosphate phosphatase n=1 Tax=Helicobacter didelphidarum TaxID=2040648 RepID=A0A3D8INJ2_9HELI|nr:HAD family hydrolase [Helicobacter didelphidarum]RDU66505.1 HAD family hydrolase [Helicobacter didelphidarum]